MSPEVRILPPPPEGASPAEVLRQAVRPRAEALAALVAALEGEYGPLSRAAEALALELAELAEAAACSGPAECRDVRADHVAELAAAAEAVAALPHELGFDHLAAAFAVSLADAVRRRLAPPEG